MYSVLFNFLIDNRLWYRHFLNGMFDTYTSIAMTAEIPCQTMKTWVSWCPSVHSVSRKTLVWVCVCVFANAFLAFWGMCFSVCNVFFCILSPCQTWCFICFSFSSHLFYLRHSTQSDFSRASKECCPIGWHFGIYKHFTESRAWPFY